MKRVLTALLLLMLFASVALAAKPKAGDTLPDLEVKDAVLPADAAYLGLPEGGKSFRLSHIKADALLVNVFSMYCPRCQAEAPAMNKLFERLKASPQGKRFKFLGLGAGNSPFEVGFFRKKSTSPIPMYQDADYALHKQLSNVGTPSFFVLRPLPGGAAKGFAITFFQEGFYENEDAFFTAIVNAAGLK